MKHIFIVTFSCLSVFLPQYTHFSAGLSYSGEKGLNAEVNYNIYFGPHNRNTPQLKISILGEPKPGLLGEAGHVRIAFQVTHPNKNVKTIINGVLDDFNENIINYNPALIEQKEKLISQYQALEKYQQKVIEEKKARLQENDSEKKQQHVNKKLFLKQKKVFELWMEKFGSSYKDHPDIIAIQEMIKELEKE